MTTQGQIVEGFETLRLVTDPRGHALLGALERVCILNVITLDGLLDAIDRFEKTSNVVPLIRDYSAKP